MIKVERPPNWDQIVAAFPHAATCPCAVAQAEREPCEALTLLERVMASLFVGGIRDGDWFQVPDDRDQWNVCDYPDLPTPVWPLPEVMEPQTIKRMAYHRMKFRGLNDTYSIFAAPGLTPDHVLLRLIEGYRAPDEPSDD